MQTINIKCPLMCLKIMKTTTATIRLLLRTSKVLSDGSNPIYLRCNWNGMKEISTGYSCTDKHWDKKNECIKKGYPNYATINAILIKLKNEAIDRRNQFELNGITYTPAMILKQKEVVKVNPSNIEGLIKRYTVGLSAGTCKVWKSFWNSFKEYSKISDINEVDVGLIKNYGIHLSKTGMKDSTIKMTLSKLAALCRYAVEQGIIKESPFKQFNYGKVYKVTSSNVFIHHRTIEVMKEMFLNEVIEKNGELWHYKDGVVDQLLDRTSKLFARYFWLCGVLFQGLAPIDLCQLKVKDLEIRNINGVEYYCWDGKRQKTKIPVKIRIKTYGIYSQVMVKTMLMFHTGEYLLPILDGVENDGVKITKRVNNWISNHIDKFRDWLKVVNEEIVKRNVANNDDIPLATVEASFYSYRHSYAQMYLAQGGSPLALATLLGRSVDTISTYIEQLSEESDLAKAASII